MGGIGKTTLARKIYDDPLIAYRFDVHMWTTISQKYELIDILLGIIQEVCQSNITKINNLGSIEDVGQQLWRGLKKRRYLCVIDDIWDVELWRKLRTFFPNDCNGSRIILTSRDVDVAKNANPNYPPYGLSLMDSETSWELLSKKVFSRDCCPKELVPIGKLLALKCQGLPLAVNLVAGHLSKVRRTSLDWLNIDKHLPSLQEDGLDILALSYNYMPTHLKKCFIFAANEYTRYRDQWLKGTSTKKPMSLWIAAGYINAEPPRSLEDVAEECLQELTRRNLVMLTNRGSTGRRKMYIVHDLMIDMCKNMDGDRVRIRKNSRFLEKIDKFSVLESDGNYSDEGLKIRWDKRCGLTESYCNGMYPFALFADNQYLSNILLKSIKEDFSVSNYGHLKLLEISIDSSIPTAIYKLCNLQNLINPKAILVRFCQGIYG